MPQFKVVPKNAKERTRVADHGDIWETTDLPHVHNHFLSLLASVKTGHIRWWANTQITQLQESPS